MDKHDRPYKCPNDGCEKLPGFTYSGGLLRHQREVHNLHGGPRKQLNCHYPNCKRHHGKGFSRQENLNEHLRRVHTASAGENVAEETDDDSSEGRPYKRKRTNSGLEGSDVMGELARMRVENEDLKRNAEIQSQNIATCKLCSPVSSAYPNHLYSNASSSQPRSSHPRWPDGWWCSTSHDVIFLPIKFLSCEK